MPRQQQPDLIRTEYFNALQPFIDVATHAFARERDELIRTLKDERIRQGKMDASNKERALALVDRAARAAVRNMRPKELEEVARRFGKRTDKHQREQLNRQVVAAMSVPLSAIEAPVRAKIEGFATTNVELIKTVHTRYFDRLRGDVEEAFETGMHPTTLAKIFVERDGMAEDDARRIARDQIGKLNAQVNQERQELMGVTAYIWRTSNDERVRPEHAEREGERFEWDDPPEDGHPGEAIQCRCFSEPIFDAILADIAS